MAGLKVVVLAVCMLLFGTINTLTTKFQDLAVVGHTPDGKPLMFKHPAVQSAFMFFGEMLCLAPYFFMEWKYAGTKSRVRRRAELKRLGATFRLRRVLIFAIPAACDSVATTLLNVGLFYTFASTYQMLRGTLVLFAGFFTVVILRRQLFIHHWLGMVLIMGGAALVGAASVLSAAAHAHPTDGGGGEPAAMAVGAGGDGGGLVLGFRRLASVMLGGEPGIDAAAAPLFGDLCVVAAQAFTALQFILEEKFVAQYRVPTLLAVGLEGLWGMGLCGVALPVLAAVRIGPDRQPIDAAAQAFREICSNGPLAASVVVGIASIGAFNFFGISVTRALSGAARATIDATRTLFVWLASMWLGWERFLALQVVGFAVLFAGTSLYNELIRICLPRPDEEEVMAEEEEAAAEEGSSGESGYESSGSEEETDLLDGEEGAGRGASGGKRFDEEAGGLTEPLLPPVATGKMPSIASAVPPPRVPSPRGAVPPSAPAMSISGAGGGPARGHLHQHHHRPQQGETGGAAAGGGAAGARPVGRRTSPIRDISDNEYTMARSMRLGHSTLMPHALDVDTETESEGPAGYSPGMSFGSGQTGILSQPNIPEGDEDNELVHGPMSGVDADAPPSSRGGRGGGGGRVSIAMGPHGMLSGGVGRGGGGGGGGGGGRY